MGRSRWRGAGHSMFCTPLCGDGIVAVRLVAAAGRRQRPSDANGAGRRISGGPRDVARQLRQPVTVLLKALLADVERNDGVAVGGNDVGTWGMAGNMPNRFVFARALSHFHMLPGQQWRCWRRVRERTGLNVLVVGGANEVWSLHQGEGRPLRLHRTKEARARLGVSASVQGERESAPKRK